MPVSDPATCSNKAEVWNEYFYRRRGAEILAQATDEVVEEHRTNPTQDNGHHSIDLHEVLNFLRALPIMGKEFVYAEVPYERYFTGQITERGGPAEIDRSTVYASEHEAMHAVFLQRLNRIRTMVEGRQA